MTHRFLIWPSICLFLINLGSAAPLDVQIEVDSHQRVIHFMVKNNTEKSIDYHGGIYGGAHIEISKPQGKMLAIDDSGLFAMISLPPGKQSESRIYIESPHFNVGPNEEHRINITFGSISIGGAGVKVEALSLVTDAYGAIDVMATQETKISYFEATADINRQRLGESNATKTPIVTPASTEPVSIKLNGALLRPMEAPPNIREADLVSNPKGNDPNHRSIFWIVSLSLVTLIGLLIYTKRRYQSVRNRNEI